MIIQSEYCGHDVTVVYCRKSIFDQRWQENFVINMTRTNSTQIFIYNHYYLNSLYMYIYIHTYKPTNGCLYKCCSTLAEDGCMSSALPLPPQLCAH